MEFLALYRGPSIADSDLVAVSSDPDAVQGFIETVSTKLAGDPLPVAKGVADGANDGYRKAV